MKLEFTHDYRMPVATSEGAGVREFAVGDVIDIDDDLGNVFIGYGVAKIAGAAAASESEAEPKPKPKRGKAKAADE